jgi:choline dehydrogenase-like flavoprotein
VVAAYSIETPRLLLNSACPGFPDGLCNDFDQVGRYVMVQGAPQTAGRYEVITIDRYAHLIGGCRMARDARNGVVGADLRSFAVPNLYIVDGSVFPTQGSANPALTIMASAARTADHLARSGAD